MSDMLKPDDSSSDFECCLNVDFRNFGRSSFLLQKKKHKFFYKKLADISQIKSPVRNCRFQTGYPSPQKNKNMPFNVEDFRSHDL